MTMICPADKQTVDSFNTTVEQRYSVCGINMIEQATDTCVHIYVKAKPLVAPSNGLPTALIVCHKEVSQMLSNMLSPGLVREYALAKERYRSKCTNQASSTDTGVYECMWLAEQKEIHPQAVH